MRRLLLAASCLAAAIAFPREARAGIFLGAELDAGEGIGLPGGAKPGVGFLGTLGYRIGIGPVFLQPEAQGGYVFFPRSMAPATSRSGMLAADAVHVARAIGGARFGLGPLPGLAGIFQPSIFGHAGVGWLDSNINGIAADAGIALAFRLIPILTFGAQGSYNVVTITAGGAATRWVGYGVHVAVEI